MFVKSCDRILYKSSVLNKKYHFIALHTLKNDEQCLKEGHFNLVRQNDLIA